nr:tellurium resistance protein TerY [Saprospiraceae bacterium]
GLALEMLHKKAKSVIILSTANQKGDWKPLLFLFTDGKPSDIMLYREMIPKIKAVNFGSIIACAAGNLADDSLLKELTDNVVHLDSADSATLKTFFKWVSETIEQGNKSQGTGETVALPPPPSEITIVI